MFCLRAKSQYGKHLSSVLECYNDSEEELLESFLHWTKRHKIKAKFLVEVTILDEEGKILAYLTTEDCKSIIINPVEE